MKVSGKNIVITGASSGIGKYLTEYLSSYPGVKIVAAARREELIPQTSTAVFVLSVDVSTKEGIDQLFAFSSEKLGKIDLFIANAGFAYAEKIDNPDWKHIDEIFRLNVFSPIYSLEKFIYQNENKPLQFVTTISAVAYFPLPAYSLYCSTKSALRQFFETYRYEQKNNLVLSNVYPVATRTDFFKNAAKKNLVSLPFLSQEAQTVAKRIIEGIEHDKRNIYPSFLFRIFLPFARVLPFLIRLYALNEKRKVRHILTE